MRIDNNATAMSAYVASSKADSAISVSMERMVNGLRINSAEDDATGLVISEQMKNQIAGFNQAIKNAKQGMSMLKTAEGAMGQQEKLLGDIRTLIMSSNSGNMTDANKATIQNQINELVGQIDDIAKSTQYNGKNLIDGSLGSKLAVSGTSTALAVGGVSAITVNGVATSGTYTISESGGHIKISGGGKTQELITTGTNVKRTLNFDAFGITIDLNIANTSGLTGKTIDVATASGLGADFQVGANTGSGQSLNVKIGDMTSVGLGLGTIDVTSATFASNLTTIDAAIKEVSDERATLGSRINRFTASMNNLEVAKKNLTDSQSLIAGLDMTEELVTLTKNQVTQQVANAMLAQANQQPQAILQLLR